MPWVESLSDICAKYNVTAHDTPVTRRLISLLHEDYERQEQENPREPGLHVSHAGKCQQQVFYDVTGAEKTNPLTADSLINFKVGRSVEEVIADLLEQGGVLIRETVVSIPAEGEIVTGHIDVLVWFPDTNEIWELKSIASKAMSYLLKKGEEGRPDARQQLNLYMHASRQGLVKVRVPGLIADPTAIVQDTGKGLYTTLWPRFKKGHLVYVIKDATVDEPTMFDFELAYDEWLEKADLLRMAAIKKDADQGIDPGIPPEYMDEFQKKKKVPYFPCSKYCQYREHCCGTMA